MTDYRKEIGLYLDEVQNKMQDSLDKIADNIKSSKYVCVFGAGMMSEIIISMLKQSHDVRIDFLCDNDNSKWGKRFNGGLLCISPDELAAYRDDVNIIIATRYCSEVYDQLQRKGFSKLFYLKDYRLLNTVYFGYGKSIESIKLNTIQLMDLLCDEKSKETLFTIVRTWFDFDVRVNGYERVYSDNQYYPDGIIELTTDEAFVDGGAYQGDSLFDFLEKSKGSFHSIFAFELDPTNFQLLKTHVNRLDTRLKNKITLYNLGLLDRAGIVGYETGNSKGKNSFISENSQNTARVKTVRLSDILRNKKVTYIKMDLEGSELEALQGAEEIIKKQNPKLAVCVYHKIEHLWEIPFFLRRIAPKCKLFLRHHSTLEYETVCYAIP